MSASCAEDPRWLPVRVSSDFKIGIQVVSWQAPDVKGSALGMGGPVSVCCDWFTGQVSA